MSVDTGYPVIQEMNLPAVPSKLLSRTRRDLAELPPSPPGTALVFLVDGQFHVYDERRRLTGNESFVTEALAVAVVDLRPRRFFTDLTAHSLHPAEDFTVQVTFEAVVDRPESVTRIGSLDLPELLADHLNQDREIAEICGTRTLEDIALVRKMVDARIWAFYQNRPLYPPGIQIALQKVEVLTPTTLAERDRARLTTKHAHTAQMFENELSHERRMQSTVHDQEHDFHTTEWERTQRYRSDALEAEHQALQDKWKRDAERRAEEIEWQYKVKFERLEEDHRREMFELEHKRRMVELTRGQEQTELKRKSEDAEAERMADYANKGVQGLMALAVAQGLISPLQMVEMLRETEEKGLEYIRNLVDSLIREGRSDLVTVDMQTMVDRLQAKLLGQLSDEPQHALSAGGTERNTANARDGDAGNAHEITSRDEEGEDDDNPPDEEDFE